MGREGIYQQGRLARIFLRLSSALLDRGARSAPSDRSCAAISSAAFFIGESPIKGAGGGKGLSGERERGMSGDWGRGR